MDSKAAVSEVLSMLSVPVDYTHVYMSQWFSARLQSVLFCLTLAMMCDSVASIRSGVIAFNEQLITFLPPFYVWKIGEDVEMTMATRETYGFTPVKIL